MTELFRFSFKAAQADREGYYYTDWSKATPITVVAANKQDAMNLAESALGPPRRGRYWLYRLKTVTDHRIPEEANRDV